MNFAKRAEEINDYIISCRHYLHEHAELSYKEYETTKFIVSELKKMGIPVESYDDYTGCIATISSGKPGRTILLRADIDALPIQENSGVEFQSKNPGVMHACGHDCHTSMLLGAAKLLWEQRSELQGTVKLLFQAAEEAFYGSHYYWDKGHLKGVDAAVGMHVWPTVKSGCMAIQDGDLMASCDNFVLTVHGKSAHGSTPNLACDAIVAASNIICDFQTIVGRINNPLRPLVVTVGKIQAGTAFNIIADTVVMEGTVRAYDTPTRDLAEKAIRNTIEHASAVLGCTATIEYDRIEPPVCNNDTILNDIARNSACTLYGKDVLKQTEKATGSEDFSYIMERIPSSLFIFMGCYDEESGSIHPVHNEKFRVNEDILHKGAAEYAQVAADYLSYYAGGKK